MFYGNAHWITVAFVRNLLAVLMEFYKTTFICSHHLTRLNTLLIRVFEKSNFDYWFQILRLFVWHMEFAQGETLSFRSSDLVLHSSINQFMTINGRNAMAAHS